MCCNVTAYTSGEGGECRVRLFTGARTTASTGSFDTPGETTTIYKGPGPGAVQQAEPDCGNQWQ